MYTAAERGHYEVVEVLLDAHGVDPSHACISKAHDSVWTPIYAAANRGHHEVVEVLLAHDADPNMACGSMVSTRSGSTALETAVDKGRIEVVRLLLLAGNVDPHHTTNRSELTPLHVVARRGGPGDAAIVQVLLEHGANPHQGSLTRRGTRSEKHTPLYYATKEGHTAIITMLRQEYVPI